MLVVWSIADHKAENKRTFWLELTASLGIRQKIEASHGHNRLAFLEHLFWNLLVECWIHAGKSLVHIGSLGGIQIVLHHEDDGIRIENCSSERTPIARQCVVGVFFEVGPLIVKP